MVILQSIKDQQHKLKSKSIDLFEKFTYKKIRKKIQEKLKRNSLKKVRFSEEATRKLQVEQLLAQLIGEKMQSYNDDLLTKTYKNIVSQHEL